MPRGRRARVVRRCRGSGRRRRARGGLVLVGRVHVEAASAASGSRGARRPRLRRSLRGTLLASPGSVGRRREHARTGPLGEIHDASSRAGREGGAALFGFFALPAGARSAASGTALREACIAQLVRLFGEEARAPRQLVIHDWTTEPLTAGPGDERSPSGHPTYDAIRATWGDRLHFASTETAPNSGGYLEGALEAAERAAAEVLAASGADAR